MRYQRSFQTPPTNDRGEMIYFYQSTDVLSNEYEVTTRPAPTEPTGAFTLL